MNKHDKHRIKVSMMANTLTPSRRTGPCQDWTMRTREKVRLLICTLYQFEIQMVMSQNTNKQTPLVLFLHFCQNKTKTCLSACLFLHTDTSRRGDNDVFFLPLGALNAPVSQHLTIINTTYDKFFVISQPNLFMLRHID